MLFTKGRPKAWEAPEDKAGMQGKPAHSWSGDLFFTCSYFQEHKCVFFSWSPVCLLPAHSTGLGCLLCWVVFPWIFSAVSLPAFCSLCTSFTVGFISRDAFPAPVVKTTLIWLPPCPSPPTIFCATHFYLCSTSLNIEHILQIKHCAKQFPYILWIQSTQPVCEIGIVFVPINEETDLQGFPLAGSSTLIAVVTFLFSLTHLNNFLAGHDFTTHLFHSTLYIFEIYLFIWIKIYLLILIAVFHFVNILHWCAYMLKLFPICSCYSIHYNI